MAQKKFNFKGLQKKVRTALEVSLSVVGNTAKNFFVENFRKQGFDDKTVEKWKPRKKEDKRSGRAILVKSGDLRRSIIRQPVNKANLKVTITSDLPYSKRHNEGLDKMPKRQFMGNSYNMNEKIKKELILVLDRTFKK